MAPIEECVMPDYTKINIDGHWVSPRGGTTVNTIARNYDYVIVGAGSAGCAVARRLVDSCDATIHVINTDLRELARS